MPNIGAHLKQLHGPVNTTITDFTLVSSLPIVHRFYVSFGTNSPTRNGLTSQGKSSGTPKHGPAREPTRNGLTSQGKSSGTVRKSFFQGAIAGNCVKNRTKQVIINF